MCSALQIGASTRFAKRSPTRLKTVATPRKWSIRKISSSGTTLCRRALKCTADAWSVPNGFSSASRVTSGRSTWRSSSQTFIVTCGGSAKKTTSGPSPQPATSSRRAASSSRSVLTYAVCFVTAPVTVAGGLASAKDSLTRDFHCAAVKSTRSAPTTRTRRSGSTARRLASPGRSSRLVRSPPAPRMSRVVSCAVAMPCSITRQGGQVAMGRAGSTRPAHPAYSLSMTTHEGPPDHTAAPRVIHTAQALVDEVVVVDALPVRGGNAVAQSYARYAGGAVTILVAAARSGASAVLAGSVGTGPNGDLVRAALAADGV